MKIKEIVSTLEAFAPLSFQESYDNSGLIIGNEEEEANGALLTLDATEEIIDEAINLGVNMVIAHHPIVFGSLKKINGNNYIERTVIKAIKNNIAIYAAHTNLDNALGGVNFKIAEKLSLQNPVILALKNNQVIGSGVIGTLKTEISSIDFLRFLKERMELRAIRHTKLLPKKISKVAVCGGSGSFLLQNAIKASADAFVTSDFKYHEFFDAENHLIIADIGHYESEQYTKELLRDIISKNFPNFATYLSQVNTNPIQYYS